MPTITVTIYPRCEAVVERKSPGMKHLRAHEERCNVEGARHLIIGWMGTVEQNLCIPHKRAEEKRHPDWIFQELRRAVKRGDKGSGGRARTRETSARGGR
jgi:hypothetical protein